MMSSAAAIASPPPPSPANHRPPPPHPPSSAPTFFSQPARHPTPIGAPRPTVHHEPLSQRLMDWMVAQSNAVPAYPVRATTAPVTRCTLQDGRQERHSHTRTAAAAARVAVVRVRVMRACILSDAVATSSQWGEQGGKVCPLAFRAEDDKRERQASERASGSFLFPLSLLTYFYFLICWGTCPRKNDAMQGGIGGASMGLVR